MTKALSDEDAEDLKRRLPKVTVEQAIDIGDATFKWDATCLEGEAVSEPAP
jgi:hypothetical protein